MTESFSQATASFLSNLIELGVCDRSSCGNAYYPLPADFTDTIAAMREAAGSSPERLVRPAVPLPASLMNRATAVGSPFPTGAVGRQLTSSLAQLSMSLQHFVDVVFTALSVDLDVRLETLLYSLCLLERVQRNNMLEHQRRGVVWRDSMSSLTTSVPDTISEPSSSSSSHHRHDGSPFGAHRYGASTLNQSPTSTGTVGPLTDAEAAAPVPVDLCRSAHDPRFPAGEADTPQALGALCAPSTDSECCPLSRHSYCGLCNRSRIFGIQYYNAHLLLAACLSLSTQINEPAAVSSMSEDKLTLRMAAACGCDAESLTLAVRLVCETLCFDLTVAPAAVSNLLRRLGAVEALV